MSSTHIFENTRDVLREAMALHGSHEAPTAREVLAIQIRLECARNGLPKPDFNHFPPSELGASYFESLGQS